MKHYLILSSILMLITSCYHENIPEEKPPETLLSEQQMVNILTDIYIAEGTIAYQKVQKNLPDKADAAYYEQIFEKHNINHRVLKENMDYYNADPERMALLLEKVLENLSRLQTEIESSPVLNDTIGIPVVDTAV